MRKDTKQLHSSGSNISTSGAASVLTGALVADRHGRQMSSQLGDKENLLFLETNRIMHIADTVYRVREPIKRRVFYYKLSLLLLLMWLLFI